MADELIYMGDEVKATTLEGGAVKLGGYLVRFGDASQPDLAGDYFTKSTDFGEIGRSVTWFNHRQPVKLKKHNVQVKYTDRLPDATLKMDDVGVFAEVVIEARNEYEKTIAELGMAGKLAWSSGTASHLVDRKSIDKGVWEITRWPLGLDASLTPTPAEPRGTNQIQPIKSLIPSDDAPLCDADEQTEPTKTTPNQRENNMEEEIKSAVATAVAEALAAQKAIQEAEALKAAELKAAEEAGYKKAVEDLAKRRAVKYHSTEPVNDDNDGVGKVGEMMLGVARAHGFVIPTLCHHEGLNPYGACRLCLVEVLAGGPTGLHSSCTLPVGAGLEVANAKRIGVDGSPSRGATASGPAP